MELTTERLILREFNEGDGSAILAYQSNPLYLRYYEWTEFKLHRIWSWCIADNVGSARVLEKLGMRQEGRLHEHEYFKGRWWDTLLYAILDYEWAAHQQPPDC
jgi:RimJ/RimL family protein N-acetyltransferase